jgi:hypothetical protein
MTTSPVPTAAPLPESGAATARRYEVRTFGCQMNVHDSERLAGLLEGAGYRRAFHRTALGSSQRAGTVATGVGDRTACIASPA